MYTLLFPLVSAMGAVMSTLDPMPEDEDIKAGYVALFLWLGLLAVIGLLGWSMVRHLRTSESNRKAGLYPGDPAETDNPADAPGPVDADGQPGANGPTGAPNGGSSTRR